MIRAIKSFACLLFAGLVFLQTLYVFAATLPRIASVPVSNSKNIHAVRVLVAGNERLLGVTTKGAYRLWALPSGQLLKKGGALQGAMLAPTEKGIRLDKEEWAVRGVRIQPREDGDLIVGHTHFRGTMDVLKNNENVLYAINRLNVEDYLYGVLHYEVASWWPMAALKVQAIAARTYALYQASVSRGVEYDLKSSTSSQVYGGSTTEKFRTRRAVDLTSGEVLAYRGKIFPAYFHATCAGVTAGANELWKIDLPPLAGGVHCGYCKFSPHYYWKARVPLPQIEERMVKYGHPVGQILKIEIITKTPSARVGSLRITGTAGDFVMAAKDFRVWIGGDRIRSTLFEISLREDIAEFNGRGWGHGVGLCQWGALGQALLGRDYQKILKFYYPGADIISYESK